MVPGSAHRPVHSREASRNQSLTRRRADPQGLEQAGSRIISALFFVVKPRYFCVKFTFFPQTRRQRAPSPASLFVGHHSSAGEAWQVACRTSHERRNESHDSWDSASRGTSSLREPLVGGAIRALGCGLESLLSLVPTNQVAGLFMAAKGRCGVPGQPGKSKPTA